jgi:excisionase family DNA binding protein
MSYTDVAPRLMTINDVATLLGVSTRTVQRWISDGRLKAIQLGGRRAPVRVDPRELEQWLKDEGVLR